ncbi:MAG: O-antigen ligase family protein [Saprospiraceae bacterium]
MNLSFSAILSNRSILWGSILVSIFAFYCIYTDKLAYLALFPLLLFAVVSIIKPDFIWYSIAFFTPISINPNDVDLGKLSLSIPTEPLLVLLIFLFFYYLIRTDKIEPEFFKHPFSILILMYLGWMLITCFTSVEKIVSFKFWISKLWFIIPVYFLGYFYIRDERKFITYIKLFLWSLTIVSIYNIVHLSTYQFEDKPSQWTMQPFFKSHAVLGAVNAMCLPLALGVIRYEKGKGLQQVLFFIVFLALTACLIFTYSRAAWISVVPSVLLYFALKLKIPFRFLLSLIVIILVGILLNLESIIRNLETNKVASSDDLIENVESISNISTDVSNLERINRWACAVDMWKSKPLFGFGPGTYMFEYAPFQLSGNRTEISTNSGDVGNAHSEYLGPLAEQGLLGGLLMLALLIFILYYSFKTYLVATTRSERIIISMSACALISYLTHGFLNNFLDMDKAAVPFWALICALVASDLRKLKVL